MRYSMSKVDEKTSVVRLSVTVDVSELIIQLSVGGTCHGPVSLFPEFWYLTAVGLIVLQYFSKLWQLRHVLI